MFNNPDNLFMQPDKQVSYRRLSIFIPITIVLLLLILAFGYYRYERNHAINEKYLELRSIGNLKARQISDWYEQRVRDASFLSLERHLPEDIELYLNTGKINKTDVLLHLDPVISENKYEEILIFDTTGNLIFSVNDEYLVDSSLENDIQEVIKTKTIVVNSLYFCPVHNKIHHDVLAPVYGKDFIAAILLLRTDPYSFLYPYIQEWPVPSKTAETILVEKDGDSALFLNELNKVSNLALKFKVSLLDTMVPAVKSVLGEKGMFEGQDYKGDKVLSHLEKVSGTPWSMVVKVDRSELFKELWSKTMMMAIMFLLTILIIIGAFIFGYNKRQTLKQRLKDEADHQLFAQELKNQVAERTSELERSNQDLLSFAHVASHDLKEPVRKIKTFLSIIQNDHWNDMHSLVKTYLKRIGSSADRLESLIDGVLNYSRSQNSIIEIEKVDLNELVYSILYDLELMIIKQKAEFNIKDLPCIEGSKTMLYQLFYNLISNSLKFIKVGESAKINITYSNHFQEGKEFAEIVISDNGIGFDPTYSQLIFESFKRLHSKDAYEGTGLGLALCKRIVIKHNGCITATSKPGSGAEFNILLPVKQK